MKDITIYLIDDDQDDRELFQIALEDTGLNVKFRGFSGCMEALAVLKLEITIPDYIFLDLNMPKMNGHECLYELKKHTTLANIPVIIFSTSSDPGDKEKTSNMGAIDFVVKPSKTSELTRILQEFISRHPE